MIDMVVHRHELKPTLARLCGLLMRTPASGEPRTPTEHAERVKTGAEPDLMEAPASVQP